MAAVYLLIIDGLGVGAQEDAVVYGDLNTDTLGHVSLETNVSLPNFEKIGLGNISDFHSVKPTRNPLADWGKMREVSGGKDSTSGHWEIAGIHLEKPLVYVANGFSRCIPAISY